MSAPEEKCECVGLVATRLCGRGDLIHMVFDHTYFCFSARLTRQDEKNYVVGMYVFSRRTKVCAWDVDVHRG